MANRILNSVMGMEKQVVKLFGEFLMGAAGAVSSYKGLGITSITKSTGSGTYLVNFEDAYDKFLGIKTTIVTSTGTSIICSSVVKVNPASTLQASVKANKQVAIQFLDYAGAKKDPESAVQIMFEANFRRSNVGPT